MDLAEIKKLCDYADSKRVVSLIDKVKMACKDNDELAVTDKLLISIVLDILRNFIVATVYEQYVKCIEKANLIINELEIEKSQR